MMPLVMVFLLAVTGSAPDLISAAIDNYEKVRSYRVTLKSRSDESEEIIRYFYRKPGFVKMEFVKPYSGTVLTYNPHTEKVKVVPFGFLEFLNITLDPDSSLLTSSAGHRIDKSDIGELLESVRKIQKNGSAEIAGEEHAGERDTVKLNVKGEGEFTVDGINAYRIWLDRDSLMPVKVSSFDTEGRLMEEVLMDDLDINVEPDNDFFGR